MVKITFKGWKSALVRAAVVLAAAGTIAYMGYALNTVSNALNPPGCTDEIKPKHSRKQIEEIVREASTPTHAFLMVSRDIAFKDNHDISVNKCHDRWTSMIETYALRTGDCEDGAIAFAAMLSDSPEYEAKVVSLKPAEGSRGHSIAVYRENGKWGFVSFNVNLNNEKVTQYKHAVHETMEDAIRAFCRNHYKSYAVIDFTAEELKFGRALQEKEKSAVFREIE